MKRKCICSLRGNTQWTGVLIENPRLNLKLTCFMIQAPCFINLIAVWFSFDSVNPPPRLPLPHRGYCVTEIRDVSTVQLKVFAWERSCNIIKSHLSLCHTGRRTCPTNQHLLWVTWKFLPVIGVLQGKSGLRQHARLESTVDLFLDCGSIKRGQELMSRPSRSSLLQYFTSSNSLSCITPALFRHYLPPNSV